MHLRDGEALKAVARFTAERFGRAIVMPNLKSAITTTALAGAYRQRILAALPAASRFEPLMTLVPHERHAARRDRSRQELAASSMASSSIRRARPRTRRPASQTSSHVYGVLARMEEIGMRLLVHGESPQSRRRCVRSRNAFHRQRASAAASNDSPPCTWCFEHITTARAVEFVGTARNGVAATITPQHLLHNRNAIFSGGIRPHYYCLPILKRERDRRGPAGGRNQRQPALFPGHRQRAARAQHQRNRLRLRGHVHRACSHRVICGSL